MASRFVIGIDLGTTNCAVAWAKPGEGAGAAVHGQKPWVQFGISPFGIYRPGVPNGM